VSKKKPKAPKAKPDDIETIPRNRSLVPVGRPTRYHPAMVQEICDRIIAGETVRQICMLPHMPHESNLYIWLSRYGYFRDHYARAKQLQMDRMAEEIIDIADDGRNDWEERENSRTGATYIALNSEAMLRSKLRIETRWKLMQQLRPKKYGDFKPQEPKNINPPQKRTVIEFVRGSDYKEKDRTH
jgi:hypothetical protein